MKDAYLRHDNPYVIVRLRRIELGLTQQELADRVPGWNNGNFITMIEKGRSRPPLYILVTLAEALEIDPMWFIERVLKWDCYGDGRPFKYDDNLRALAEYLFNPHNMLNHLPLDTIADYIVDDQARLIAFVDHLKTAMARTAPPPPPAAPTTIKHALFCGWAP